MVQRRRFRGETTAVQPSPDPPQLLFCTQRVAGVCYVKRCVFLLDTGIWRREALETFISFCAFDTTDTNSFCSYQLDDEGIEGTCGVRSGGLGRRLFPASREPDVASSTDDLGLCPVHLNHSGWSFPLLW